MLRSFAASQVLIASSFGLAFDVAHGDSNTALLFDGVNDRVTFGPAPELGASTFTVETWFNWSGSASKTTSTGGLTSAVPLVTKGRGEADGSNVDINYFLGIQGGKLAADYEEGTGQLSPGRNHPLIAATTVTANEWHHAAVTFDGTSMVIYLDGVVDGTLVVGPGRLPQWASIQHAALGTALRSTGSAGGFFAGVIDEARIWNVARSGVEIRAAMGSEITAEAGLLGAWHLDEGAGGIAVNAVVSGPDGSLVNGPTWVDGFVAPELPVPVDAPVLSAPADGAIDVSTAPMLDVVVSGGAPLDVSFFGRPLASGQFTLIGTQSGIASGAHAMQPWPGLDGGQSYEWYATVSDAASTITGPTWNFHTAAGSGTVFVGAGDIASCASPGDEQTAAVVAGIDGVVFTTGDNVYDNGTSAEFSSCYDPSWGQFRNRTRPVPGNHDWGSATPGSLAGYFGYFGADATDAGGMSYYSYDLDANWHVVNLDSECANVIGGCGIGSPQVDWLTADLAANSAKNVIAVWHRPRFSSAGHASISSLQPMLDVLYEAGVDIALTGHAHVYERFEPLDPNGAIDPAFGIRHFLVGTGGEQHHTPGAPLPGSAALDGHTWGVLKLVLHPTSYEWQFLPVAGETFTDAGAGIVHGPPTESLDAPVLSAPADGAIDVSTAPMLDVVVSGGASLDVSFFGRRLASGQFTLIGTQSGIASGAHAMQPWPGLDGGQSYEWYATVSDAASTITGPTWKFDTIAGHSNTALLFDGVNDRVTFGPAPELGASTFTVETWFNWSGSASKTTSTGGLTSAVPLVTKGRGEADGSNVDINYFLGIQGGKLAADYEEGTGQLSPGRNHPLIAATTVTANEWHHAAVTFDGTSMVIYLDGVVDGTLVVGPGRLPQWASIQHAALGTALRSTGSADGFFAGVIDEARIWNVARSGVEIRAAMGSEITAEAGLLGAWHLDEGAGGIAVNAVVSGPDGSLVNGPTWVDGFVAPGPP